ncbi:MAG: serine hydroxymethyltransferase, partial [Planctomycetota bacterium]
GKRYYEGQQITDQIENLARDRAKELFGAEAANVQPHSGSSANLATYCALAEPGSTIMGLSLPHGGHLTHGWKVSYTGKFFNSVQYELNPETGRMDYDAIAKLAKEHKPKILISGSSAYPRAIDFTKFQEIAESVGAYHVSDMAHIAGLVAGKAHMSPIPYSDVVTTTTHKTLRGPRGGMILCKEEHLTAINKSVFPGMQGGPHMNTISAVAIALGESMVPEFASYAAQVVANAKRLAEKLMGYGFDLVTGGTDNHLILIDLRNKNLTGRPVAKALDKCRTVQSERIADGNACGHNARNEGGPDGSDRRLGQYDL